MSFKIKRLMDNQQNLEPEIVRAIMSLAHTIGFTETIFVSAAGDNSDGSSWNRAYTNLRATLDWIEANQAAGEVHCILLQAGNWDLNLTGVPTYTASIAIYGVDARHRAIISNGHATATGVLQFTGWCSLNNLTIDCGTGETGINLNGAGANGSRLRKLFIDCTALAAGNDAILLDGGISDVKLWDIVIHGEVTNTSGIRLNDAYDCIIQEIKIRHALVGLQSDHADDDGNEFTNCHIHGCATGIQIVNAGATENHFDNIYFNGCTVRITDAGTTTMFSNIFMAAAAATVSPDDVAGVLVVGAAGANNWTAVAVQIRAVSATPFKIVGIAFECAAAERTGIRLYSDGGTTPIFQTLIETGAAVAHKAEISVSEPIWVNQGLAIHARVKSEAGGNNTLVWLLIKIV